MTLAFKFKADYEPQRIQSDLEAFNRIGKSKHTLSGLQKTNGGVQFSVKSFKDKGAAEKFAKFHGYKLITEERGH